MNIRKQAEAEAETQNPNPNLCSQVHAKRENLFSQFEICQSAQDDKTEQYDPSEGEKLQLIRRIHWNGTYYSIICRL